MLECLFLTRAQAAKEASFSREFENLNFPSFSFKELVNKDKIGCEGFSSVFTAGLPGSGEKVAVKKFLGNDQINAKILLKEAKLLNKLLHQSIVGFKCIYVKILMRCAWSMSSLISNLSG